MLLWQAFPNNLLILLLVLNCYTARKIHEKQKEYDKIRDEIIQQYWVKILRIQSSEIYDDISSVLQKITSYIPSPSGGGLGRGLYW